MAKLTGKVLIAQGGGPTAVINQSLVGAVLESRKFPEVTRVYGATNGVRGIVNEDFLDLSQETTHNLEQVAMTPSSALLSTREKPDDKYCQDIFRVCQAHDVPYFFYIGGNDSADTVRIVNLNAESAGYDMRCIHIPKTVDNDLMVNDHTPGYGSAARYVSQAFMGYNLDNRALPGVFIGVIMGRNAGFLTAAASLGRKYPDDGPHLVYVPERPFSEELFLGDVKETMAKHGRCLVAVSEGVKGADGKPFMVKLTGSAEADAHGNLQLSGTGALGDMLSDLVKEKLKIKRVRADTLGDAQRSYLGVVSDVDAHEAREVGEKAAQFAIWHDQDGSITIQRTGNYSVDYKLVPLEEIAAKTKTMPKEFLTARGNDTTTEFYNYGRPLLGSGFPTVHRLRAPSVAKILKR
ncbi:MAG: 6-phosphofructokinase [Spirochaetes bacterium]|nr:6-phosphofructokinase [Spirochaetota bacterium]